MADRERCSQVRMFDINNRVLALFIDLDTDATFIIDEDANEIGLEFDSGTKIHYKGKVIGRIRLPHGEEAKNMQYVRYHGDNGVEVETIDTGVSERGVECYLDAEVFITKYLIENKIITLEE